VKTTVIELPTAGVQETLFDLATEVPGKESPLSFGMVTDKSRQVEGFCHLRRLSGQIYSRAGGKPNSSLAQSPPRGNGAGPKHDPRCPPRSDYPFSGKDGLS
jgi:hypothetical protein